MTDYGSFGFITPRLDMEQLLSEARHRWLRPQEICQILQNYQKFHISSQSPIRPTSGSLFLFDRKVLRYFRKDGHNWRKKKDGKTIKEAHEKLKVGSVDMIHCYYAHGEGNENFQRRCYWMLEQDLMHIVFVHYLEVKSNRTSPGMKENIANSLNGTTSVNIDSTAASPTSTLSSLCEDADSGDSHHQANSILRASPEPQAGNLSGWTSAPSMHDVSHVQGNRAVDSQAWDAVGNSVTRYYNQPSHTYPMPLVNENRDNGGLLTAEHLRNSLQTQLDCQTQVQDDLQFPKWSMDMVTQSGVTDDTDLALFEQSGLDDLEVFSSLLGNENQLPVGNKFQSLPSSMESEDVPPVRKSLLRNQQSLEKVDSFSRWASKALGEMEDLQMQMQQPSREHIAWNTVECETVPSLCPSLPDDQRFTIVDYWPKSAHTDSEVEVMVFGTFLLSSQEVTKHNWSCMFGEVEVPAEILVDGVLSCHAPPHTAGLVPFYVTCSNRFTCSELREFNFLPGSTQRINPADIYGTASIQSRLERLLTHRATVHERNIFDNAGEKRKKIVLIKEESEYLLPERDSTSTEQERLFKQQCLVELYIWLIHKVTEEGKGPNILDEDGQGVLHFVASLGYDWAIKLVLASGVNINFRDAKGWSALHWAAFSGREETVAVLVSLGADSGALTDPSPELPLGKTAADLAYVNRHRGISGFLAESSLTSYLEKLTVDNSAVQTVSERTASPMRYGDVPETLSWKDSLTAVRNATQAADRLHQVFRMQSLERKQLSELADDDVLAVSFAASKISNNQGLGEVSAATHIQKKYRGWKKRKEFLLIRQRVVKIQAHVRGHQVRKQYRPIIWSVGILEKIILRWRRKGTGLRGFKSNAIAKPVEPSPTIPQEDEYDFLKEGRKQTEQRLDKALTRVKSMVRHQEARDQYRRLLTVVEGFREASSSSSMNNSAEEVMNEGVDDFIDIDSFLNDDDTLMTISP